ncbi:CDP-alcohol phosphatidyltransferase family protein [Arcanobacterium phocae]|uniref:CDP-alcohol phosphatidyltransferase family protein n=1 Tax=Arcanobacterium phocae TaxID=131112 RepID=UPI001C0F2B57|nr:phosphatidylcholine synthase [Arcanobacterium phocae]
MKDTVQRPYPLSRYIKAWAVHAFTMTGVIWVILATRALMLNDYKMMWLWLGIALVVDAADGPMARKAKVIEVVPWFSGTMMDNIVDYMTWTMVPVVFMAEVLPFGGEYFAIGAASLAATSSMFCYANTKMKSSDWYFVGFPAAWNIVIVILWLFGTPAFFNWIAVIAFTILAVIPWKWVHPFRVKHLRIFNALAAITWVAITALWVIIYPATPLWVLIPWWISGLWLLVAGAIRTWRDRPDSEALIESAH